MDQQKIGSFLKELRKEKDITQEQLAEKLNVSRRTVSRWETGSNLPDLDLLIEVADFYQVDLRELLNGERKSEQMNPEMKETLLQAAEYANEDKKHISKTVLIYLSLGILALIILTVLDFLSLEGTFWLGFAKGGCTGLMFWALLMGILHTTGSLTKVKAFKKRLAGGRS